ncbi:MAG: GGDEF domain-containing protein [Lachnospiraceae bacterium]|nr:GGDEF domain-containing protein [Lachnospiraceae bacterium]
MKDFIKNLKWISKIGIRGAVFLGIMLTVFTVFIIVDTELLSKAVRDGMRDKGALITDEAETEFDRYLSTCVNAITISAHGVERMLDSGAETSEIAEFLTGQTENYVPLAATDFTGIYGCIKGEYVDGSGWVPDEGYDPVSRPWYIDAIEGNGDIQLVDPYMDQQTKKITFSICKMLSDGESVLSMDVTLQSAQASAESLSAKNGKAEIMIISNDGVIVVHSTQSRTLGNIFGKTEVLHSHSLQELTSEENGVFKVGFKGKQYYVYFRELYDDWYVITAVNIAGAVKQRGAIFATHIIMLVLLWGGMIGLFMNIGKKRAESSENYSQMYSISGIYTTMDLINLEDDTFEMIRCDGQEMRNSQEGMTVGAHRILRETLWACTSESSQNKVFNFIDFETLDERLSDSETISIEYLDNNNEWCRGRFTVVERKKNGRLKSVLWMIEPIDKEKREREHLEWLSETDRLTGIMNRGGGEEKIRQIIETGGIGMLAILDADHFKSINDTFGHQVGDAVIIAIANCMKKSFRDVDVVMRLGGDEFSVFLSDMRDKKVAEQALERFIENVRGISIPQITDRKIEVSIGAAFLDQQEIKDFESLYKKADSGVYESKKVVGSYITFVE